MGDAKKPDTIRHTSRVQQQTLDDLRWLRRAVKAAGRGRSWDAAQRYAVRAADLELGKELDGLRISVPEHMAPPPRKLTTEELNLMLRSGSAVDEPIRR
jgi:hypothetical protein